MGLRDLIIKNISEAFFVNKEHFRGGSNSKSELLLALCFIIFIQILLLFFGKYLWNNYLTKYVKSVNRIESVWHLLAISILVKLMVN